MGNNQTNDSKFTSYIRGTRIARLIIIFLLILFTLIMLIFGSKYLTKQNFVFMSNYLTMQPFITSNEFKDIKYDNVSMASYYEYNNRIVIKNDYEIAIFSLAGNLITTIESTQQTIINCKGNYICLFEENSNIGQVYNSFFKVQDIVIPENERITSMESDNDGNIIIVSESSAYRTNLRLYSNSFGLIYEWKSFDKYTCKASVNEKGDTICILSSRIDSGLENTILTIASIKTGKVQKTILYENEKPYYAGFIDKNIFVLTNKSLVFMNDKYFDVSLIPLNSIVSFYTSHDKICVVTKNDKSNYDVTLYDKNGLKKSFYLYNSQICDISLNDNNINVLDSYNNIYIQSGEDSKVIYESSEPIRSILNYNGYIVICTKKWL